MSRCIEATQEPVDTARPLGKPRGIGFGIFLFIITLSIYGWYWAYKTQEELKQHTGDGLGGVVGLVVWILLTPVTGYTIPSEIGKMYAQDGREKPMTGWTGLWFFPGVDPHHPRHRLVREGAGGTEPLLGIEGRDRVVAPERRGISMVGRKRNPWVVLLLIIVTLGIYGLYWIYISFAEVKARRGQGTSGIVGLLLALIPVSIFLLPSHIGDMYAEAGKTKPITGYAGLWALIPIVGSIVWLFKVQGRLNEFWGMASEEATAPAGPAPAAEEPAAAEPS